MAKAHKARKVPEIPLIGDVDDWEEDFMKAALRLPHGGECMLYIDSAGGSVYSALAVATLMRHRTMRATCIVLGECSSATVLVFAACQKRLVTRYSTFLFHRMRWQSDKRIGALEAGHWARHFEAMERDIDELQEKLLGSGASQLGQWIRNGQYISGTEMAAAGLAELIDV
jgi:ATP-dependent Clp protease protease subunit